MRLILGLALCAACGGGGSDSDGSMPPDAKAPPNTGFVQLSSQSFMASNMMFRAGSASASFATRAAGTGCSEQAIGACTLITCPATVPPATNVNAGTITVTGAAIPISLTTKPDNTYTVVTTMTQPLFIGDETLAASGSGGDVPAFSVSVTAPSRPTITAPAQPAAGAKITINRAQGFHATWMNRSAAGKVYLYFSGPQDSGITMSCGFASTALAADVPAAALAMLPAGTGSFNASAVSQASTDVGDWRVYADGFFNAVWPDNTIATGMATFQ
jgi:hypothetical protein